MGSSDTSGYVHVSVPLYRVSMSCQIINLASLQKTNAFIVISGMHQKDRRNNWKNNGVNFENTLQKTRCYLNT